MTEPRLSVRSFALPDSAAELAALGDHPALGRALSTLRSVVALMPEAEPLAGALARASGPLATEARGPGLARWWLSRAAGDPRSETRYRWELTHRRGVTVPDYAGDPETWQSWRGARAEGGPFDLELALFLPIVLGENAELLLELADGPSDVAGDAQALIEEAAPVLRRDFARYVQLKEPWEDTFVLWCLTRNPRTLSLLHPIAVAIASCCSAGLDGPVVGVRFPFHGKPLVSASAQLAAALLTLGTDLELAATLAELVANARAPSGGWGDAEGGEDVLTTLVAADLLCQIDPSFQPASTELFLESRQGADGLFRALGPDAPWTTLQVLSWSAAVRRPFSERFRWPHRARTVRDHKTGLPFFAHFIEIAQLFAALPGLARERIEIAFIDLIGFRAFNNRFGQDAGDDVLRLFARHLDEVPSTRAIRDGGDEFLVIGAPTLTGLHAALDGFRASWPERFRAVFGSDVPPVTARVLIGSTRGRDLRSARQILGRGITGLKSAASAGPDAGVLVDAGELSERGS